jgi:hypothetical protein
MALHIESVGVGHTGAQATLCIYSPYAQSKEGK